VLNEELVTSQIVNRLNQLTTDKKGSNKLDRITFPYQSLKKVTIMKSLRNTSSKFLGLNLFLSAVFGVFAWFQRNDIDPTIYSQPSFNNPTLDSALWFLFYLIIAFGFIVISFRKLPKWYFAVAIIACFLEMATTGPGLWNNIFSKESFNMAQTSMTAEDPRVELTREFFGALLALIGVAFQLWQSSRIKNA
jgi:hypothetical protein